MHQSGKGVIARPPAKRAFCGKVPQPHSACTLSSLSRARQSRARRLEPGTLNPEPGTLNPEPGTRNPEPGTRNPAPGTRNPEP